MHNVNLEQYSYDLVTSYDARYSYAGSFLRNPTLRIRAIESALLSEFARSEHSNDSAESFAEEAGRFRGGKAHQKCRACF